MRAWARQIRKRSCARLHAFRLAACLLSAAVPPAQADDEEAASVLDPIVKFTSAILGEETGREIWTGADIADDTWLVFSGFTYAPMGGIFENGPRIRIMGGYGGYAYERTTSLGTQAYSVEKSYTDLLAGYQHRVGELTAKVFAGLSFISHDVSPLDGLTPVAGSEAGLKAMIELWLNIGEAAWVSLDAAWGEPFNTSSIRPRAGYRVWPQLSLGVEGALNLDEGAICRLPDKTPANCAMSADVETARAMIETGRGGLFARYDWITGEASLSVGAIGGEGTADSGLKPYATVQWLSQF